MPADPAFVGLPPLTASGVAERLGFSRREIDGLCAALDHSIAAILSLGGGTTRTLHVDFTLLPSRLEVELGTIDGGPIPAGTLRRLGPAVASLVSSFEPAGPRLRLSLVGPDAAAS